MPEIPAMEPVLVDGLHDPPSPTEYRVCASSIRDHDCAVTIYTIAKMLLEWEKSCFMWQRNASPDREFLQFFFEKTLEHFACEGPVEELHLFEDLYYVSLAKIMELHNDLKLRFQNGFISEKTVLFHEQNDGKVEDVTADDMMDRLEFSWEQLTEPDIMVCLEHAVKVENIISFKTKHNVKVFLKHKRYSAYYDEASATASVRQSLKSAFDERELLTNPTGLLDLSKVNAASLMAHVWNRDRLGLRAWHTEQQRQRQQQTLRLTHELDHELAQRAKSFEEHARAGRCNRRHFDHFEEVLDLSHPVKQLHEPKRHQHKQNSSRSASNKQQRRARLRHRIQDLHRARALFKIEGLLPSNHEAAGGVFQRSNGAARSLCDCDDGCECAYWCRKEKFQICACKFPAIRIQRTRPASQLSVDSSLYTRTDVVSEASSITSCMIGEWSLF